MLKCIIELTETMVCYKSPPGVPLLQFNCLIHTGINILVDRTDTDKSNFILGMSFMCLRQM